MKFYLASIIAATSFFVASTSSAALVCKGAVQYKEIKAMYSAEISIKDLDTKSTLVSYSEFYNGQPAFKSGDHVMKASTTGEIEAISGSIDAGVKSSFDAIVDLKNLTLKLKNAAITDFTCSKE